MRLLFICAAAALALTSCGKKQAAVESAASAAPGKPADSPELGSFGVDLTAIDKSVDPGDNFYEYVNGEWLKTFKIPDEHSSYGSFTMLTERTEQRLKAILEELLRSRAQAGSPEQKIRDFYSSYLDINAINSKGLAPIAGDIALIDQLSSTEEIAAHFLNPALRMKTPIAATIGPDAKRPERYAVYITQSGLGMPSRDYYLDERFAEKRAKYEAYVATNLSLADFADPNDAAARVVAFETEIARAHWDPAKRRNRDLTYNLKNLEQLEAFAPSLPWRAMFASAGLQSVNEFVLREDDAVRAIADIIATTAPATLRDYLKFQLINANADVLPSAFDDANFAFFGSELKGAPRQKDRWKRSIAAVDASLGEAVARLYVERHFPPGSKAAMDNLVLDLRAVLKERLATLDWMSEDTRGRAAEKLAKFRAKIGYPEKWRDLSALTIVAGDPYGNAKRAQKFEWDFEVARLGEPVDRDEWSISPQTVNAYYNPTLNEIVFPAAILEPPFFDPKADTAVNYGAIGAVIGHEIGHGFDDQGRKSDGDGVLRDWWSSADAEHFSARAREIGAQFAAYEPIEGFAINGDLTMGENIGDLGGLAIAYHAYKLSLGGKEAPVIDGVTGDQRFFLAWAQAWKRIVRDEQLKNQIATDPHSPAQFRVNGVVRNMNAWYEAFNVTPDDDLWLDPEHRIQIW